MQTSIVLIIDQSGGIKINAVDFAGADCEKATAFLEEALGKVGEKTRKSEYYRTACVKNLQRLQR